jgi:hypothetical protein
MQMMTDTEKYALTAQYLLKKTNTENSIQQAMVRIISIQMLLLSFDTSDFVLAESSTKISFSDFLVAPSMLVFNKSLRSSSSIFFLFNKDHFY